VQRSQLLNKETFVSLGISLVLLGIFGLTGYIVVRFGFKKSIIDELWRFNTVFGVILVATLVWQIYTRKLEGALTFILRLAIFVSVFIISTHFLLTYYPANFWLIDLIAPTALALLVSQLITSYNFAGWTLLALAVSIGIVYLATFDLGYCAIVLIPLAIGLLSGLFGLLSRVIRFTSKLDL